MSNEIPMTKPETCLQFLFGKPGAISYSSFGFRHCLDIRHSRFFISRVLPVEFRRDDIQASQHGNDVAYQVAFDEIWKKGEVDEARGPATGAVGDVAAVADQIKPQFAVRR